MRQFEERLLRWGTVLALTGKPKHELRRMIRAGEFPRPFRFKTPDTRRTANGWAEQEVRAWIRLNRPETDLTKPLASHAPRL